MTLQTVFFVDLQENFLYLSILEFTKKLLLWEEDMLYIVLMMFIDSMVLLSEE